MIFTLIVLALLLLVVLFYQKKSNVVSVQKEDTAIPDQEDQTLLSPESAIHIDETPIQEVKKKRTYNKKTPSKTMSAKKSK
jgi:hypothetical protein